MVEIGEPALQVWNAMSDVDMNFLIVDHDEGVGIDNGSKVCIWVDLTENVFNLHSNDD